MTVPGSLVSVPVQVGELCDEGVGLEYIAVCRAVGEACHGCVACIHLCGGGSGCSMICS